LGPLRDREKREWERRGRRGRGGNGEDKVEGGGKGSGGKNSGIEREGAGVY